MPWQSSSFALLPINASLSAFSLGHFVFYESVLFVVLSADLGLRPAVLGFFARFESGFGFWLESRGFSEWILKFFIWKANFNLGLTISAYALLGVLNSA